MAIAAGVGEVRSARWHAGTPACCCSPSRTRLRSTGFGAQRPPLGRARHPVKRRPPARKRPSMGGPDCPRRGVVGELSRAEQGSSRKWGCRSRPGSRLASRSVFGRYCATSAQQSQTRARVRRGAAIHPTGAGGYSLGGDPTIRPSRPAAPSLRRVRTRLVPRGSVHRLPPVRARHAQRPSPHGPVQCASLCAGADCRRCAPVH